MIKKKINQQTFTFKLKNIERRRMEEKNIKRNFRNPAVVNYVNAVVFYL